MAIAIIIVLVITGILVVAFDVGIFFALIIALIPFVAGCFFIAKLYNHNEEEKMSADLECDAKKAEPKD